MPKQKILIVDDEAIVRESIRDWLKNSDYDVATAENGEEALATVNKQDFDVMVVDIRLEGESGITVLEKVKTMKPNIKSIVITAYPSEETIAQAKKLGAIDYLIKPLVPEDLEKLIQSSLKVMDKVPVIAKPEPLAAKRSALKLYAINSQGLKAMVEGLLKQMDVIGVKAKQGKFIYEKMKNFDELCLDYDVTVLPPTKFIMPAKEKLLKYKMGGDIQFEPVIESRQQAFIGVHPDDINAIELLDDVFMSINPDPNYIARRKNTIIIGIDCLHPSPKSFAPSMGTHLAESGFDLLLTDIGTGYLVTVGSKKGAEILNKYANPREVTGEEIAKQKIARDAALSKYQMVLDVPKERLLKLLEENYDNTYWETRSKTCLSCGSCVMVCPTCFCFDVQEETALNLREGERYRKWDGCVLVDFAKVATGENFRHDKASRFRHRIFRKGKYIMEKYGRPGCVGCGRCAVACLAKIASPVESFNAIAEDSRAKREALSIMREARTQTELYLPRLAKLVKITELGAKETVFDFTFIDGVPLGQVPGQFVEVSIPGVGEAPISVSSSPTRPKTFQLAIRNVGSVTQAIHNLKEGAVVGIRGPFGNGFPLDFLKGKDLVFLCAGIGLFPLRSLIQYVLDNRSDYGRVIILSGARTPGDMMFREEQKEWSKRPDVEYLSTIDKGDASWTGNVGVITTLIPKIKIEPKKTVAVVVGPPIMYRFAIVDLKKTNLADENIIMSLERRMKCGVGKCGHCQINGVYVCQEGPVFSLAQLRSLREAI
jgi:sulfite reductase subunit B